MPIKNSIDPDLVSRLRSLPVEKMARILGLHFKQDKSYEPTKFPNSKCYHISLENQVFEIIVTGLKWYSVHRKFGGGGAIDLTMHIFNDSFTRAYNRLKLALEFHEANKD